VRATAADETQSGALVLLCVASWAIPGAGHLWLGRRNKGLVFLVALWGFFFRRMGGAEGGVMSFARSRAKIYADDDVKVRFGDVAAIDSELKALGFRQFRVRFHGEVVRIEIARDEMERALSLEMANRFTEIFKKLGFKYVTLDLEGYRQGSMNEVLGLKNVPAETRP